MTLQNIGNATLNISGYGGIDAEVTASDTTDCLEISGSALAAGTACKLDIYFIPSQMGFVQGKVVVIDNALNVASSQQTITVQGTGGKKSQNLNITFYGLTYGEAPVPLTVTASSGLPVNCAVLSGPATVSGCTLTITGAGALTIEFSQAGNSIYAAATSATVTTTVAPASLTVVAHNQTVAPGAAIPTLTGTLTGVVAGDGITASYTTTAVQGSPAGPYPITPALHDPNGRLANYSVTSENGILTVGLTATSVPLVLSLSPVSVTAGGAQFTQTVNGADFASNAVVLWNGAARATHYVSSTQLTATILASDISAEGTDLVTVANPAPVA